MSKRMAKIIAFFLLAVFFLTGCSQIPISSQGTSETPGSSTETEPVTTTTTTTGEETKKVKNILLIGNSFCYYFVEELYGLAKTAGYADVNVANLYYSGCRIQQHWEWLQSNAANYHFFVTNSTGRKEITSVKTINAALNYKEWDVITLQQHFNPEDATTKYSDTYTKTVANAKYLFDYLKTNKPNAKLYWHQTWAYQVGFQGPPTEAATNYVNVAEAMKVLTPEKQLTCHNNMKTICKKVCEMNNVPIIPSGDAWQLARSNPAIGDKLCQNDYYHDGTTGGGQYLNACIFFEMLFQESCVGNTFRPTDYSLDEAKAVALQNTAHQAIAAVHGNDFAK